MLGFKYSNGYFYVPPAGALIPTQLPYIQNSRNHDIFSSILYFPDWSGLEGRI